MVFHVTSGSTKISLILNLKIEYFVYIVLFVALSHEVSAHEDKAEINVFLILGKNGIAVPG